MTLRAGTLFSGIGCPELAAPWIDWRFAAEIDPFASAVLAERFPHVPNLGDVTAPDFVERAHAHGPVDLVVFGSPCQSFSVAGKRRGLDDERGNLALVALDVVEQLRPRWFLFENVPGLLSNWSGLENRPDAVPGDEWEDREDSDFAAFLGAVRERRYLGCWRSLDAQYAGVAQRRERLFFVGHLGDWRPAAAVLFEPESLRGDPAPSREARQGIAGTVAASPPSRRNGGSDPVADQLIASDVACPVTSNPYGDHESREALLIAFNNTGWWNEGETATGLRDMSAGSGSKEATLVAFGGNRTSGPIDVATAVNAHGGPNGRLDFETETFIAHSLRADGFDASEDGTGRGTPLVAQPLPFDPRQIHHPANHSNPKPGDPSHPLRGVANAEPAIVQPFTIEMRGRGDGCQLEYRQDGTANALRQPNGGRGGMGVGAVAYALGSHAGAADGDQTNRSHTNGGPVGSGISEERAHSLRGGRTQAIAFCAKDHGADASDLAPPLRAGGHDKSHANAGVMPAIAFHARQDPDSADITHPLDTEGFSIGIGTATAVRRLTPRECERLQGLPDDWTLIRYKGKPAADGPRYRAIGNGMAVPVVRWILARIGQYEAAAHHREAAA